MFCSIQRNYEVHIHAGANSLSDSRADWNWGCCSRIIQKAKVGGGTAHVASNGLVLFILCNHLEDLHLKTFRDSGQAHEGDNFVGDPWGNQECNQCVIGGETHAQHNESEEGREVESKGRVHYEL